MLSPEIYRLIEAAFGNVIVIDEGCGRAELLDAASPQQVLDVLEAGERYVVDGCPFCDRRDTKLIFFHLYHPFFGPHEWCCSDGHCERDGLNTPRLVVLIARLCTQRRTWHPSAQTPRT